MAPNQKWAADFTYIWTAEGWLYVAVVPDLFSPRIAGWSMQSTMTSQLVANALMMAMWRRGRPREFLHHSYQGSQDASERFQKLLVEQGIACSMSRAGEVWDNSVMESFSSSIKTERMGRMVYRTRDQARVDVFDYIDQFHAIRACIRRSATVAPYSSNKRKKLRSVSTEPAAAPLPMHRGAGASAPARHALNGMA